MTKQQQQQGQGEREMLPQVSQIHKIDIIGPNLR